MRILTLSLVACVLFSVPVVRASQFEDRLVNEAKSLQAGENLKISAFLVRVYSCPPCPPDADCKPCDEPNITIGEDPQILFEDVPGDKHAVVYLPAEGSSFVLGNRYLFTLKIGGNGRLELVSAEDEKPSADQTKEWRRLTDRAYKAYQQGDYSKAQDLTMEAWGLASQQFGPNSLEAAESMGNLGVLMGLQGSGERAKLLLRNTKTIRDSHGVTDPPPGIESEEGQFGVNP